MTTKLHECNILPLSSSNLIGDLTIPLTHFDIPFLLSKPIPILLFFDISCSKPYFLETILPCLQKSLSTTLAHFLPLAGNVILPSNSGMPVIHYVSGNSVSLIVSQSDQNFCYLTGDHQRFCDEFYPLVPEIPPATTSGYAITFPMIAFQITLFPNKGICISYTHLHVAADASSMVNFVKAWALVSGLGEDFYRTGGVPKPVFDRDLVLDPGKLKSKAWNLVKNYLPPQFPPTAFPINKVRSTFILTKDQVQNLKNYAYTNMPNSKHLSSLALISGYIAKERRRKGRDRSRNMGPKK